MKKVHITLMSLFVLLGLVLAGCGGEKSETSKKAGSGSGDEAVLDLWYFDAGAREEVYKEAVERFEAEHDVKVNMLQVTNDDYKQRVVVGMSGGNPPDVFASWGGGWLEEFANSGKLLDLTNEDIDYSRFVDVALENSTFDGKVYGLPLGIAPYTFYYNKEIFEKYNLEVPETYDELLAIIDELKSNDIIPIALANQPKWPGAFYLMYFADRIGGEEVFQNAYRRTGGSFEDEAYVKAGEYIQDLVKRDAFNPGFNGIPYDSGQGRQLMYTGEAAMMLITSGFVNNVRQEYPEFEEKMGVFPFPALEEGNGDPSNIAAGVSPVWSIHKDTKHPDLAVKLIDELSSVETAQGYVDKSATPVAVKGVTFNDPFVNTFSEWINNANSIQFPYDQTLPPELGELHKNTTFDLFGTSMTPEEAAKAMEKLAKELLDK